MVYIRYAGNQESECRLLGVKLKPRRRHMVAAAQPRPLSWFGAALPNGWTGDLLSSDDDSATPNMRQLTRIDLS